MEAIKGIKLGKAARPSKVNVEMIIASGKIGIVVLMKLCQQVLDGKGMPEEWKTSALVPIFKRKGDIMNCSAYREVKLLENAMKVLERILENLLHLLVDIDSTHFGFMPGRGTIDALII